MTTRRAVFGTLAAAALFLLFGRWSAGLYTDYLWFASLDAGDLWRARVTTTALLTAGSFAATTLFAFVNLYAVRQSVVSLVLPRRIANLEIGEEVPGRYLFLVVCLLSALIGGALTLPADTWTTALLARVGRPFGDADPYFGADLGFFVYWLPFETTLHYWAIIVLVVVTALVVFLYALTPSLRWDRGSLYVSAYVRRHFTMLGGALMLLLAWSYRLAMYRLLASGAGSHGVFTAVDHRVVVPATLLLSVVTLCAAVVVMWAGWSGQIRLAFLSVTTVLALSLLARVVAPLIALRSVEPAAATARERPYQATRLGYTRRAYGVDRMRPELLGAGFRTALEAAPRAAIWDGVTLSRAVERMRHVRIVGDGAAWQGSDSGLTAMLVERGGDASTGAHDVWGIGHFDPTGADERGLPVRMSAGPFGDEVSIDEPAVYDSAPGYSLVSDSLQRLAGVEMVSTRSRLAHAWSLQNFRLLFGDLPLDRPTILRRRDVRERVDALAPFFVQGSEVVPVFAGDSLYWVVELYAASATYPLSQRFTLLGGERSYFQHAATAVVHATSGRVRLVVPSAPDPIAASWVERFPRQFVTSSALPAALQSALPPITDGARAQALAFSVAGFRGDSLEVRHFAVLDGADSAASREPLHAQLPGLGLAELVPLLDGADRLRGVVAARGGAARETAWVPVASDGQAFGAVVDRLRTADTAIRVSGLIRSPLRALPVGGSPLYFQSVFQARPGGGPQLARVGLLLGDTVRYAPTLAAALGAREAARPTPLAPRDLRTRAESLYKAMREALGRGDWGAFGRAFDALGLTLRPTPP